MGAAQTVYFYMEKASALSVQEPLKLHIEFRQVEPVGQGVVTEGAHRQEQPAVLLKVFSEQEAGVAVRRNVHGLNGGGEADPAHGKHHRQ